MPIWYGPVPGKDIFHVIYSGVIGLHDVLGFFDQYEADFRAHPNHREFCDARHVEDIDISPRELQAVLSLVVGIYRRNDCNKRISFLAADGLAKPVLNTVVQRFSNDLPVVRCALFDAEPAALEYIGLPPDYALRRALH